MGVVDSEYVFHKGIQTLGGSDHRMTKVYASSFPNCWSHLFQLAFIICTMSLLQHGIFQYSVVVTWIKFLVTLNLRTNMVSYISFCYLQKSVTFSLYSFVWTNLLVWIIAPVKLCRLLFCCQLTIRYYLFDLTSQKFPRFFYTVLLTLALRFIFFLNKNFLSSTTKPFFMHIYWIFETFKWYGNVNVIGNC